MSELVSVVVACYNHERYIESCLKSIIDQTYENIEVLICDDCSSDNSYQIIQNMKPLLDKRFSRVEVIRNEINQGVCRNLNNLISGAHGDYIKTISSDDMLHPDAIDNYVRFTRNSDYDIVFANALEIHADELYPVNLNLKHCRVYNNIPPHGMMLTKRLCGGNFINGATQFFPAKTFNRFGYYCEDYCYEDWEYCLRVSVEGNIGYMDTIAVFYRVMSGTLSHYENNEAGREKHRRFYKDKKSILSKYIEFADTTQIEDFYNQSLRASVIVSDKELIKSILSEMKEKKIKVLFSSRVRIRMLNLGVYRWIRSIKRTVKGV